MNHKEIYTLGIKAFNNLPTRIKRLTNIIKHFKSVLKKSAQSFYPLDVNFNVNTECIN